MSIVNRRNAFIGWTVWQFAKREIKRQTRRAVPGVDTSTKRPNKSAIALAVTAVAGLLVFWRKKGDALSPSE